MTETEAKIHLLLDGLCEPGWNMAVDDALLSAKNRGELPGAWVRLYGWRPPAISLGRLQEIESELAVDRIAGAGVAVVRRATGGKAVYHANELTYAVIGSVTDPTWGPTLQETYRVVTAIIAGGLQRLGIATEVQGRRPDKATLDAGELRGACFGVTFGHELTFRGRKICGSAQRRLVHAFLQHGSLLLGDEHIALAEWLSTSADRRSLADRLRAEATDVGAACGREVSVDEIRDAMIAEFENRFPGRIARGTLPSRIRAAAERGVEAVRVGVSHPHRSHMH
jgi:lipoate-protein ligase A